MNATSAVGTFYSNGFIIFDYKSPTDFKYAGAFVGNQQWVIGHRDGSGWYNEPGAISPGKQVDTLCNIPELIRYTSSRLLRGQLIGAAIGALVFLFPGILSARRQTRGVPATVPPSAA